MEDSSMAANQFTTHPASSMFRYTITGVVAAALLACIGAVPAAASNSPSLDAIAKSGSKVGTALLNSDGDLVIAWAGRVMPGMAKFIDSAFARYGKEARYVHLVIDSVGGSVAEGESVIQSLRRIKRTHRLHTLVGQAGRCYSMCIPIFLQGKDRIAAGSSVWVFHDATKNGADGRPQYDRQETVRLYQRYFVEAGVSAGWLNRMLAEMRGADLWQTGKELIDSQSGIITRQLSNKTPRR
jgi:hypothetical protein